MMFRRIIWGAVWITACLAGNASPVEKSRKIGPPPIYPSSIQAAVVLDSSSWLTHDDGIPTQYFQIPDRWNDHYFNVRFTAPDSCRLLQAAFLFRRTLFDTVSTIPDVHVYVWPSTGTLPATDSLNPTILSIDTLAIPPDTTWVDSVVVPDSLVHLCPIDSTFFSDSTTFASLENLALHYSAGTSFHVGWEPDFTDSTDDTLAIRADDGIPAQQFSCEWWDTLGGFWDLIYDSWVGAAQGADLMIRVQVELLNDTTGVKIWLEPDRITDFTLSHPYPNPFNPSTTFTIQLPISQEVRLAAYDLSGRLVESLFTGVLPAGRNTVSWEPKGLPSGVYLVTLNTPDGMRATKAVLMK